MSEYFAWNKVRETREQNYNQLKMLLQRDPFHPILVRCRYHDFIPLFPVPIIKVQANLNMVGVSGKYPGFATAEELSARSGYDVGFV